SRWLAAVSGMDTVVPSTTLSGRPFQVHAGGAWPWTWRPVARVRRAGTPSGRRRRGLAEAPGSAARGGDRRGARRARGGGGGARRGEEAGDGGPAGVIGVEDVGQEQPEGDEGGEEAVAEGDLFVVEGLLDGRAVEQTGEGQFGLLVQLLPQAPDLAGRAGRG